MSDVTNPVKNPRILAAHFRVKHKDIFNAEHLYVLIHEWLKEKQWRDTQSGHTAGILNEGMGDRHEKFYMDKTGIYGDKEIWIWWRMYNFPEGEGAGSNCFFRYHMDIDFHFIYLTETEIMHHGKKMKTNKGEVELKIWSWIEMDYNGEWSKHPIMKFFLEIFRLRIFYHDLLKHKYQLYRETFVLQGAIKKYLQLKGFLPQLDVEPYHAAHGVPQDAY